MNALIKLLDEKLEYIKHEITDDTIKIWVESNKLEVICTYCNTPTSKVHSRYERSFQDLPLQGKKVVIIINNRKMFCNNPNCNHKTFAETYDFLSPKGKKSKRLEDEIINISINVSSITASNILSRHVAKVGKSTICNLLKKRNENNK
ncbi:transposase family protein [Tepidibacter sp. Z1-5]|uniref:transposase family protein n=1 Tax=Tepidibacter sp. Z1-5 TaxID=3134138 RepID=UPI0030C3C392